MPHLGFDSVTTLKDCIEIAKKKHLISDFSVSSCGKYSVKNCWQCSQKIIQNVSLLNLETLHTFSIRSSFVPGLID